MAMGMFPRLISLAAVVLLAACRQDTPPAAGAGAEKPVLRHDDAVRALLQERYGAPAQLTGQWAQQLEDPGTGSARPVQRALCADHGITLGGNRYRMLAVCTGYANATSIELGTTDFIVLHEAADGSMRLAAELPGRASGADGQPGSISTVQVGAGAWAYQIDDELVAVGSRTRHRAWLLFDGGDRLADAGWLRVHWDNHNAIECNAAGHCAPSTLALDLDIRPDDSQPDVPYWPLRVTESGRDCHGRVNRTHTVTYDPAQARYLIPADLQREECR
jgi:hypothetical protein